MLTLIIFFIILGVLILVHELGHFLTARLFKVKAEEFGFGYPPRIFGWVKDGQGKWKILGRKEPAENYERTVWSLNWLPLGGFVKIKGEDYNAQKEPDSFASRPIWQRFIMLFAGVFMNFILCFVLLTVVFMSGIPSLVDDDPHPSLQAKNEQIQVISILPDSPAAQADIKVGDVILSINHEPIYHIRQIQDFSNLYEGQPLTLKLKRANEELTKTITPVLDLASDRSQIGVGLVKTATLRYTWYKAVYKGAETTFKLTFAILQAFGEMIRDLIAGQSVKTEVAGPVGIAVLTGQVVKLGWIYVLQFTALLSINLGIINLLPIPALDGGRILFLIIEKFKGRPVKQKIEATIHQLGFLFIIGLMLIVIFNDFRTYGSKIWQTLGKIFNF